MLSASLDIVHYNEMGHNLYGVQLADLLWIVNYQDLARQQARWMDRLQIARLDVRERPQHSQRGHHDMDPPAICTGWYW